MQTIWAIIKSYTLCPIGLHYWTPWKAHQPPCVADGVRVHEIRHCYRCDVRQHRFDGWKTRLPR